MKRIFSIGLVIGALSAGMVSAEPPAADNSAVNERDRKTTELTADQQGMDKSDTEITRQIRKSIMSHKELSIYAHNVKIIATNGLVTLKGPVNSRQEMTTINNIAKKVVGPSHVKNELQIATGE